MDNQLLKNNIKILKMYGYDEELTKYPVLDIEKNREGYDNIHYQTEDGKKIYIYSKYSIEREWQMIEKNIDIEGRDAFYIVYGLGLGHHIKKLKSKISGRSIICIIEKNMDIISTYMHTQDLSEIIDKNVFLSFGNDEEIITQINKKIFAINTMTLLGNITNIILPSYYTIYGDWIKTMQNRILDVVRHAYFILGNDMEDTIIGIKNNLENINVLLESPSIKEFINSYVDVPLFIVSAGPSLDKNVCELKKAQGKSLIIATDAALSTLKKNGITPDGVVSIERILMTYEKFYKDKEIDSKTVFIGPPVVRPEIFETLKNNKKLICLRQGEKINEWLNDIVGNDRTLHMGSSCAHIAFSFGRYIGANPIVFVGQDLAYTKEGITHSNDVEVKDKIDIEKDKNIAFVKGIDGDFLPTSKAFKQFLTWFELEIAKDKKNTEYIDATEGGAYIRGTKLMPLKETIEKYCKDTVIHLYDKVSVCERNEEKFNKIVEEVKKLIEVFEEIKKESEMHILRLNKLQTKRIRDKKEFSLKDKEKIFKVINQAKTVENLVIKNDFARNLFQAPLVTATTMIRMLGNSINEENIKKNVIIQRKMVESFYVGCYSLIEVLTDIFQKMEKKQEVRV